jgi:hypothetical protein
VDEDDVRENNAHEFLNMLKVALKQEAEAVEDRKLSEKARLTPCPRFRGQLESQVTCSKCKAVSDQKDPFECLAIKSKVSPLP